jgi:hypothetical protein
MITRRAGSAAVMQVVMLQPLFHERIGVFAIEIRMFARPVASCSRAAQNQAFPALVKHLRIARPQTMAVEIPIEADTKVSGRVGVVRAGQTPRRFSSLIENGIQDVPCAGRRVLSARQPAPIWSSRRTRTCFGTPAATRSPTRATTPCAIQGWLGHRSITSTAVYTALAPNRFKDFWRD